MKRISLILALSICLAHTMNAVWYKPWTWFSSSENGDMVNDEVQYNQFD